VVGIKATRNRVNPQNRSI